MNPTWEWAAEETAMPSPRPLALCLAVLFAAVRADAATLTVTTDKSFYLPGETVTLTAVGNSGGATDYGLFASLTFNPAALLNPSSITFAPTTGTAETWIHGVLGCSTGEGPGHCWILNHIAFPDPLGMVPIEQTLATITGTAGAVGVHNITWSGGPGFELMFFGAPTGPTPNLVIVNTSFRVIPEPSTALLFGLGLAALAAIRRHFPVSAAE
jgi:hypothetical protein